MKFVKFYNVAFFKMKILCKFTSFLNFLFFGSCRAAPVMKNKLPLPPLRVRRGSGSAAMDISGVNGLCFSLKCMFGEK